jgi:formate/nitrite transporter FocA (FNT family)
MGTATQAGQAGLQGWRGKVADGVAQPVSNRTPLSEDQVRALIGGAFFVLALVYVVKTLTELIRQQR